MHSLGEGHTSKVYLAREINDPSQQVAIKIISEKFLARGKDSLKLLEQEIRILEKVQHTSIVKILDHG